MMISSLAKTLVGLLAITLPLAVGAQTYALSGKWHTVRWSPGSWNGQHDFPKVYCLTFPEARLATELGHGFFGRGGIYMTQVAYPEELGVFVVVSTIPEGRSADEEIERLLANERRNEASHGSSHHIREVQTGFGRTIAAEMRDIAPNSTAGPFPLVRPFMASPRKPIASLSVHRIFVRGPDRFEVAALQLAPESAVESTAEAMSARLTSLVEDAVRSLQECTSSMPLRTPR